LAATASDDMLASHHLWHKEPQSVTDATPSPLAAIGIPAVLKAGAIGGLIAAVANLVVYFIGSSLFSVPFEIMRPGAAALEQVPVPAIAFLSFVPALGAGILLYLLARFTGARAWMIFLTIAAIFLVVSFMGPINQDTDSATKLWLNLMHVVAAAATVWALRRFLPVAGGSAA
jgi:hypothetical protein